MAEEKREHKFPTEIIDLPSGGKIYGKDSPLFNGKIEIKYMTAKEEDILTSQNLIKKGRVVETLLDSLIVTKGITADDLILGDKNAVMVAARILAYGPDYTATINLDTLDDPLEHTFDLSACPFKKLPKGVDLTNNSFKMTLPTSKTKIKFKILTGAEEREIENELKSQRKLNQQVTPELTTRLRKVITEVDGETEAAVINNFVDNMLSRDSFALRKEITRIAPDIELTQEVKIQGDTVKVAIPMTVNFFWPES